MADISLLPPASLTERGITAQIASRYHQGMPFSTISTRTIVAMNTFTDGLDVNQEQVFRDLATRIQNRMITRLENQCCIFLGEGGSGKSEYASSLTRSLLVLAGNPLSLRCRSAQPILEAFSTAKTSLSLGASKVGMIRELQYDQESNLIGMAFHDYRLERHLVTRVGTNERNYHVFYHMVNGLGNAERQHLHLEGQEFRYLGHRSQLHITGVDDRSKFKQLKLALYSVGFSRADVANIFQVLAAVLHLGQLQFRSVSPDSAKVATMAVEVMNIDVLDTAAQLLGVPSDTLNNSLVAKTVLVKHDRVTVVLDQRGAREQTDTFARMLYTMLFSYIIDRLNDALALDPETPEIATTISLAEFPGFQPSQSSNSGPRSSPHLDRLLHNCANEMLYNYLVHVYFRAPEDVLGSEEIDVAETEYFDNAETVKTLARPHIGCLAVINDYALRDRDEMYLRESLRRRYPKSLAVKIDAGDFIVNHYAGEASYSIQGLLDGAQETLSSDIIGLFAHSSYNEFLHQVFSSAAVVDAKFDNTVIKAHLSSEPRRQLSVRKPATDVEAASGSKFGSFNRSGSVRYQPKEIRRSSNVMTARGRSEAIQGAPSGILTYTQSLDQAIDTMESAHAYFVLCLKPNDNKLISSLDARCVRQQVSALGIPELAQRTKNMDLSIFMPFGGFLRFSSDPPNLSETGETERDVVTRILDTEMWPRRDAAVGLTGVFLSESAWIRLTDPQLHFVEDAAAKFSRDANIDMNDAVAYTDLETKSLAGGFGNMFAYMPKRGNFDATLHIDNILPDAIDNTAPAQGTRERKTWLAIVWAYTWWYPTSLIRGTFASVKLAWREKLAINLIIWGICAGSMVILIGLPYFVCPIQNVMSVGQLGEFSYDNNPDRVYTSVRGMIYDISKFASSHYPSIIPRTNVLRYGGRDSSDLFPVPVSAVCSLCKNDQVVIGNPRNYSDPNAQYHDFRGFQSDSRPDWYLQHMENLNQNYHKSFLGFTPDDVQGMASKNSKAVFSLEGWVYDLTDYMSNNIFDLSNSTETTEFLDSGLTTIIQRNLGKDITNKVKKISMDPTDLFENIRCLKNLFLMGKLDTQNSARCLFARYFLLGITVFVVIIVSVKFLAALQFGSYSYPDDLDQFVICQIPVYTEDEESLRRAIDSLTRTKYDDKRKLLVIICDGMIIGAGNEKPTPRIVLNILGHPEDADPPALSFESLGEGDEQHNYGKVYTGLYENGGHIVPYLVIVKVGKPSEVFRPGNRGKRDSQLILMRFLNRVHYNSPMSPMELEMYHQIQNVIGIAPSYYTFLMQVDADTVVGPESLSQLVSEMVRNVRIQAICGETGISNARQSLTTMIQVYEYYISHNLAKAFESLFGTVTCLPGCFSLYRLFEEETNRPLLVSYPVVEAYSETNVKTLHLKNLLQLGEDRYLTTLLLKYNPRFSTKFLRHAHAYTVAPDSWSVLLSQRRRWINSTVHNMFELIPMNQICGFCLFSMRFMVLIDLFSTFLQPVTLAYIAYLIYLCSARGGTVPWSSIALIAAIYGLQIIIFVLRLRWEMIGWMFVYILALPIHSLFLPLYSFWHMDDFSWGNTRMVVGEKGKALLVNDEGHFDPSEIPLRLWSDHEADNWTRPEEISRGTLGPVQRPSDTYSIASSAHWDPENPFSEANAETRSRQPTSSHSPPAAQPSDRELTEAIRTMITEGDLTQLTKRSIRTQLECKFACSLKHRREYISQATEAILSGDL